MLNLSNFNFCVVDFQFIYPKDSDKSNLDLVNPSYVKAFGFAYDDKHVCHNCYIFDRFDNFGLSKSELSSKLVSNCVITGSGTYSQDKAYNRVLNLSVYNFNGSFNIDLKSK